IQMHEKYSPKQSESGEPLVATDGRMNAVEDHTLTFLLWHKKDGTLEGVRFADSFYQNHYQWGDGDIPVRELGLDEQGQIIIPAKTIEAVDPATGQKILAPVQL